MEGGASNLYLPPEIIFLEDLQERGRRAGAGSFPSRPRNYHSQQKAQRNRTSYLGEARLSFQVDATSLKKGGKTKET